MKKVARLIALALAINLSACGYFLYPERVGQNSGDVDPTVVILDAAGLLFGILPGVVAFAVDITTGAIYLPPGGTSAVEKHTKKLTQLDLETTDKQVSAKQRARIAKELSALTHQPIAPEDLVFYQSQPAKVVLAQANLSAQL
ncbi:hypothetical protein QWY82_01365 [Simiduia curdlanivorans]|uniref:Uncharacterized protein n=1 Tax=Simiduia curdlanivorans TaxID=1492769 RepID=A0ABV8V575_9GAMM|nr:hypothetical protein [Simiduia curdlanivorans]MDN3637444.1 hypothetical protein [Simiduia curdlanivorans]